jgi:epoxide hydrolase 4
MEVDLEDTFFDTNGICLHGIQAGPDDAPLVVLLHGFPEFWYGWRRQVMPLAQASFRILAPDQRGYNLSDKPEGVKAYRLEELSRDIIGLLDILGKKTCYLVGHDWGAAVAWNVAMAYPHRIEKLVIMNVPHPAVMMSFLRKNPGQMLKSWYIAFFQIPGLADWLLRANDCAGAARLLAGSGKSSTFADEELREYKQAWLKPLAMTSMINWYRALVRYPPVLPVDQRIHIPVLMLWGKQDVALSHEMAQPSIEFCDQGKLIFFEKASHWVQHDEAEKVNGHLLNFLQGDSS